MLEYHFEMATIEDYLSPLAEGVWEVVIPHHEIPTAPGPEWEKSLINIPTPGVIASYRKGQYHLHETKTAWKVHLDRHSPKSNPILHLIDDAPLLLMIAETFITILSFTKDSVHYDAQQTITKQARTWHQMLLAGILSIIIGTGIVFAPDMALMSITGILIPGAVYILGLLAILNGLVSRDLQEKTPNVAQGVSLLIISMILFIIPQLFWGAFILIVLALWMFSSAAFLLIRVSRGRTAVPEGFVSRSAIGIVSLFLGLLIFIIPISMIHFFFIILGGLVVAFGISGITAGLCLRKRMYEYSP
jgi:uncharacterized membrane protein HdeD (DUF308 family)